MECARVVFSGHSIQRMFERGIGRDDVLSVVASGEMISEYADDTPHPSRLLLGFVGSRAIHVVVAFDSVTVTCIVVPAYEPTLDQWERGFRRRKT